MKNAVLLAAVLSSLANAATAFTLDVAPADLRRTMGKYAVSDLAVGETGIVSYPSLCASRDGRVFVVGSQQLDGAPSEYGISIKVQRGPNNTVAFSVEDNPNVGGWRDDLLFRLRNAVLCDFYQAMSQDQVLLELTTVNNKDSLSALLP